MSRSSFIARLLTVVGLPALVGAQAINYWKVQDTLTIPATLSASGIFTGIVGNKHLKMIGPVHKFDVNAALWSDGSHKTRFVALKPNQSIAFSENSDYWGYPDSALFIKQFDVDTIPGDSTSRIIFETRFLYNKKDTASVDSTTTPGKKVVKWTDHWYGYSYKWNADQKDAKLVPAKGANDSVRVYPNGKGKAYVWKKWRLPSRDQCEQCHRVTYGSDPNVDSTHGRSVLGFFTAQLNHPHPDNASVNQLDSLFTAKVLTGTKPTSWANAPHWRSFDDTTASLDVRARSYIAANCSGCHGRRGMETGATFGVDLNYDFQTMASQMEFRHHSVSWPFGLDDTAITPYYYPKSDTGNNPLKLDSIMIQPALVVPGYPQKSVLLFRQTARDTTPSNYDPDRNQMPPLASFEVNKPAMAVLTQWIKTMPKIKAPNAVVGIRHYVVRTMLKTPYIEGRQVVLPRGILFDNMTVKMTGIDGRSTELHKVGNGVFAIPASFRAGIYIISVGKQSFTRYLF